jgi:hypothetical protein
LCYCDRHKTAKKGKKTSSLHDNSPQKTSQPGWITWAAPAAQMDPPATQGFINPRQVNENYLCPPPEIEDGVARLSGHQSLNMLPLETTQRKPTKQAGSSRVGMKAARVVSPWAQNRISVTKRS